MAASSTRPFGHAKTTWSQWASDIETCSTELDAASLFEGQSGEGIIDNAIARVVEITAAGKALAEGATELAATCDIQDGYDAQLMQAPTTSELQLLQERMNDARTSEDVTEFDEAAEAFHEASRAREDARQVHEEQTSGTTIPDGPSTGIDSASGSDAEGGGSGGQTPGDGPETSGEGSEGEESGEAGGEEGGDDSDRLSGQGTPQPQMGGQPQPQQPPMMPQAQPQMGGQPQASPTMHPDAPRTDLDDMYDGYSPGGYSSEDASDTSGTQLTADPGGGGVVHGSTAADTSGKSANPYAATGAPPGAAQPQQGMGRGMGGGMMGPGMMGGMGRGGQEGSRAGQRPEVLSDDPQGKRGDEFAFKGGLIGRLTDEEAAAEAWFAETRPVVEARENPHVQNQR